MSEIEDKYDPDKLSRIIVLIYGKMEHGGPFWCYVAVKPSQYDNFRNAESKGELNLYEFKVFGEIIVSAEGEIPPDEITEKVAKIYNTDPEKFFQPINPQEVIAKHIEQIKQQDSKQ